MAEFVERSALLKALVASEEVTNMFQAGVLAARAVVASAPASKVAPIVYGKWEPGNPICPVCGESKFKGLDADIWADWQPPFCPICGAKMNGEDNEID